MNATPDAIHAGLTTDDVDRIRECRDRLLDAAVLLKLGLQHMDDDDIGDPPSIQQALLGIADRVGEDATLIGVRLQTAITRPTTIIEQQRRGAGAMKTSNDEKKLRLDTRHRRARHVHRTCEGS